MSFVCPPQSADATEAVPVMQEMLKATLLASVWRDAVESGAVLSVLLWKQLCGQGLRVAQAHAEFLAAGHSSVRERPEHLFHSSRHAETADSTLEYQRSPPGDAQSCP